MESEDHAAKVTRVPEVGTVTVSQDNLVTFVAEDFLEKIRKSGQNPGPGAVGHQSSTSASNSVAKIDAEILDKLEQYTDKLSSSFEEIIEKLTSNLHKASAITVGYSQTYNDATVSMGTTVDEAVQSMYSLIAHSEELSNSMEPVHKVHQKIKHVKAILAALEAQIL